MEGWLASGWGQGSGLFWTGVGSAVKGGASGAGGRENASFRSHPQPRAEGGTGVEGKKTAGVRGHAGSGRSKPS